MRLRQLSLLIVSAAFVASPMAAVEITVDATKTYQTIEGFGTCLIHWGRFPRETYTPEFARFYSEEVGLNMLRVSLNGFKHPEVSDPKDISWKKIEVSPEGQVFVDFSKNLRKVRPDARIIGTVWAPPSWMKLNGQSGNGTGQGGRNFAIGAHSYMIDDQISDNRIDPAKYPLFVAWLVAVVEWHQQNQIPLYAVSPANEPRFSQWYGSCVWTGEDLASVLALLDPALEKAGLGEVLIFGPEDMTGHLYPHGTRGMIEAIAANPKALAALDRFATHGYTDGVQMDASKGSSADFSELIAPYHKPCWMTEGGTGDHQWPAPIHKGLAIALHNSLVAGNVSAFLPWQISEPKPNIHAIAVNARITPKTAAGQQYFRSIPMGSQRISAEPAFGKLQASAFRHPETGALGIIAINPSKQAVTMELSLRGMTGITRLEQRRTSATESFVEQPAVVVDRKGGTDVILPPESIVSLTASSSKTASR